MHFAKYDYGERITQGEMGWLDSTNGEDDKHMQSSSSI